MAEQVGPPARDRVEVAAAVEAFQPGAATAPDRHQRQFAAVFAHLRARVPDDREVAGEEVAGLC